MFPAFVEQAPTAMSTPITVRRADQAVRGWCGLLFGALPGRALEPAAARNFPLGHDDRITQDHRPNRAIGDLAGLR
jgi:hypothetical protein